MKKAPLILVLCLIPAVLLSCGGCRADAGRVLNVLTGADRKIPVLLSAEATGTKTVALVFNEPVTAIPGTFAYSTKTEYCTLTILLSSPLGAGEQIEISGTVRDDAGNTNSFTVPVWGLNPHRAGLLITEFSTHASDTNAVNACRTELAVTKSGNLAGITLYDGLKSDWITRVILPDCEVRTGDIVVIYWTSADPPLADTPSVLYLSSSSSRKPSSNNGLQTLYTSPSNEATLIDSAVYSNHPAFGTQAVLSRFEALVSAGGWNGTAGVSSEKATITRSFSRIRTVSGYIDTDSPSDWLVTETGGYTFGSPNPL